MSGRTPAHFAPLLVAGLVLLTACQREPALPVTSGADADGHVAPTAATLAANRDVLDSAPFADQRDFEDARRGFIASDPGLVVRRADGSVVWNMPAYDFIGETAPDSVNPSLWRQARLNGIHGLFQVTDGVYQLRGFDLSNMSLISGATGWIVVDPLTARETATAAMAFARKHLDQRPVVAVIFTHSHMDHFGGVLGVLDGQEPGERQVRIIAPEGFLDEATSENMIAGTAMSRRAMYMYGKNLQRAERGHVDSGLGKSPAFGQFGILAPTEIIDHSGQALTIDGVEFVFQNAPGTEAPAELTFYLPAAKAWCAAELTSHNLHNLYSLRGTKVRDAMRWSGAIDEAMRLFGEAEVLFASHHWPTWGRERIGTLLEVQRDTYRYIHDQTVRLFNSGMTGAEIAEQLELPESLTGGFHNRDYYGTLKHNAKAVYQAYLGWYDGNPAHLDPLPPAAAGQRYVQAMGGSLSVLSQGQAAYDAGDYRWAAQLLDHLVFAEPGNGEARALLAAAYDQLGYQAESGPWRDIYLSGAYELRHGQPQQGIDIAALEDILRATPVSRFFDTLAVRLDGPEAAGEKLSIVMDFTDLDERHLLEVVNAVLHHRALAPRESPAADATLALTHDLFIRMMTAQAGVSELLLSDDLDISGSTLKLAQFFSLFEKPDGTFAVVTP